MIRPRFERAAGINASERILAEIAERSFLSLWTYPNTFREQNRELVDLLVVFGDDVILFSDKGGAYPDSGDPIVRWNRYYRSAIESSARQLRTAENWILRFPERVFLDVHCQIPLPIELPSRDRLRIHRICVAPAATAAAQDQAGLPGLTIDPSIVGNARPYAVGQVAGCQGWVHVFDEDTMSTVMPALSTASDFVAYLRAKEALIAEGGLLEAASEKDLLAAYLFHERSFPAEIRPLRAGVGSWAALVAHPQYRAAQDRNRTSVLWDTLIERATGHMVQRSLERGNEIAVADFEKLVRLMASEDRFDRRVLSNAILDRAARARGGSIGSMLPSQATAGLHYVLLIKDHDPRSQSYAAYREARVAELHERCYAAAVAVPDAETIVGLGLDAANGRGGSEDFIYLETRSIDAGVRAAAEEMRRVRGYFIEGRFEVNRVQESEFPTL